MNYDMLPKTTKRSLRQRFAPKRFWPVFTFVSVLVLALCAWELSAPLEMGEELILSLVLEYVVLTLFCTCIILISFAGRPSSRKIIKTFADTNGFTYSEPTPVMASVTRHSNIMQDTFLAEHSLLIGTSHWQLEGTYRQIPFTLERIETYNSMATMHRRMPHYMTVLAVPLRQTTPNLAFCSRILAAGVTVFESSCIIPSRSWHQFMWHDLIDGAYASYYINPTTHDAAFDRQPLETFLEALVHESPVDVELGSGMIYIYFNGGMAPTKSTFEQLFRIIERTQAI